MSMERRLVLALMGVTALLTGCTPAETVTVTSPYLRPPIAGQTTAVAYFTITNHGDTPVSLVSARSTMASSIEVHTHVRDGEMMRMRRLDLVEIAPGQRVVFEPGGRHLMVFHYDNPHAEPAVPITLVFSDGSVLPREFEVRERQ